jgi:hypothetical protein
VEKGNMEKAFMVRRGGSRGTLYTFPKKPHYGEGFMGYDTCPMYGSFPSKISDLA